MTSSFSVTEEFAPRPVVSHGIRDIHGYKLKEYSILYGPDALSTGQFDLGLPAAFAVLPQPSITSTRPGAGVLILHQGRGARYIVLGWWDNENELPLRIWTQPRECCGAPWLPATASQSVCVWDIEILSFERNTYVERVLKRPQSPDLRGYLQTIFSGK
jgi:hypothetical protein